jgi:hypothetical protein
MAKPRFTAVEFPEHFPRQEVAENEVLMVFVNQKRV